MKTVVILRGIPGSGKSTAAKKSYPTALVCSADHFHMRKTGEMDASGQPIKVYDWKAENQGMAHARCLAKFKDALDAGEELVVVDNTNIKRGEYQKYIEYAWFAGYEVWIHEVRVTTEDQIAICVQRNVHRVPEDTIRRMASSFKDSDTKGIHRLISQSP